MRSLGCGLHVERRGDYHLALDAAEPNWVATDEDGAWILRELRAGRSRDDVCARYARRAGVSLRRALELVGRFADEAAALASPRVRPPYEGRQRYLRPERLREVWLHLTDRCNLACRHCLVSSGPNGAAGLDTKAVLAVIRQARELGAETFYFTGGEPLLRRDLPELLREATCAGGGRAVVLTNGALLPGEMVERLSRLPRERLFMQVSLDGATAERNDALRSPGSFAGAVRGIRAAREAGLNLTVATVALRRNLDDLCAIASLARELGVGRLHLLWQHTRARGGRLPRASMRRLIGAVEALTSHARSIGLVIDNLENARRMVNGDPGIKYDLSNACWDSLAIHRDGRVFPSACLVGVDSEAAGSALEGRLERIWLESEQFARWRARSVIHRGEGDPWMFLHGGGDPEQAFFAANGDGRPSTDPYLPLHRAIARRVIDEAVAERRRLIGEPPAGPVVYQLMGEDGYGCPAESGVSNGGDHMVDFVHSNCVLIQDVIARSRAQIRAYYAEAAREPKTEICQPMTLAPELLAHIPSEVIARSYGCGSPVLAAAPAAGETVLDLGSGAGLEAFIASRLVGPTGRVIGVDMTADMLRLSEEAAEQVAQRLGFRNTFFSRGLLEALPVAEASVDAVVSNCVINLSPEKLKVFAEMRRALKPGGRLVISDIVAERELPPQIRFNPRLKGECIAGAVTERKLLTTLGKLGFAAIEVLNRTAWREVGGVNFDTVTVRAIKPALGRRVSYRYPGPFRSVILESGEELPRGVAVELEAGLLSAGGGGSGLAQGTVAAPPQSLRDCLVCGARLVYLDREEALTCHQCGRQIPANARCEEGHFVCDACHAGDHVTFIKQFCRTTGEVDPMALFLGMRQSRLFPLHGPEHHVLVPAAFLTAYRNRFGQPPQARVEAAIERAKGLPGGTCAYWGGCSAALGIGIAYSAVLGATPLSREQRAAVQTAVSRILSEMGSFNAARCCRRESVLAIRLGCELSGRYLPHALACEPAPACEQVALNRECLGVDCPLHPPRPA